MHNKNMLVIFPTKSLCNEKIVKYIPKNKILGSVVGVLLGFFLPACDCAVIPVSKRLLKKKVPINVAISFMLASPIINPVVLLSTYYAFYKTEPEMFWYRLLFGIAIALIVGIIMGIIFKDDDVVTNTVEKEYACEHCDCHDHEKDNKLVSIIKHTALDLFEVVKFLMVGALIASLVQTLIPRSVIATFNSSNILSIIERIISDKFQKQQGEVV